MARPLRLLRLRVLWFRLLPRFLAVARDRVRTAFLRELEADLRPERARADAPRVDALRVEVLRDLVDFVLALLVPRPVDFFVAAIGVLSLSCHRVRSPTTAYSMGIRPTAWGCAPAVYIHRHVQHASFRVTHVIVHATAR